MQPVRNYSTIFICLLFLLPLTTVAQADKIDSVLKKNRIAVNGTDTLAAVKKVYMWVSGSIQYDWNCFYNYRDCPEYSGNSVIANNKAVCVGYSMLFDEMCRRIGVRSGVITGNVKSMNRTNPFEFNSIGPHAWNYFIIKDKYYLADCTWGNPQQNRLVYFDADPAQLVVTHFPADPQYFLLKDPPTYDQFSAYPQFWGNFFSSIKLNYRDLSNMRLKDSVLVLPFFIKPGKDIMISVNDYGDFEEMADYIYDPAKGMRFTFKKAGYYKITLFETTKRNKDESEGEGIFEMRVNRE